MGFDEINAIAELGIIPMTGIILILLALTAERVMRGIFGVMKAQTVLVEAYSSIAVELRKVDDRLDKIGEQGIQERKEITDGLAGLMTTTSHTDATLDDMKDNVLKDIADGIGYTRNVLLGLAGAVKHALGEVLTDKWGDTLNTLMEATKRVEEINGKVDRLHETQLEKFEALKGELQTIVASLKDTEAIQALKEILEVLRERLPSTPKEEEAKTETPVEPVVSEA